MRELTSYNFTEALSSREGYRVLGDDLNSWTQGGCWVLAEAIKKWVGPRAALYAVRGRMDPNLDPIVHHVIARVGDYYLDADGIDRGPERVRNTWTHTEWLLDVSIETFLPRYRKAALEEGLVCPPAAVKRVTAFLEKKFGPGEKAVAWMDGEEVRPNPKLPQVKSTGLGFSTPTNDGEWSIFSPDRYHGVLLVNDADVVNEHVEDQSAASAFFKSAKNPVAVLKGLWVAERLRGQGLGRKIVTKLLNKAHSLGASRVYLEAVPEEDDESLSHDEAMARLVALYESFGFKVLGRGFTQTPMGLIVAGPRSNPSAPLVLYHGSQRWEGDPRVVPHKKGHAEAGAGIYMTTSFETAKKYAKGGGSVIRFELDPNLRWLEGAKLPVEEFYRFVMTRGRFRPRQRELIGADLLASKSRSRDDTLPATVLLNLMVNHEAISGAAGVALAEFYVQHGIDASHDRHSSEDWVVLFNPAKIRSWRIVKSADVPVSDYDLPRIVRSNPLIPWWT